MVYDKIENLKNYLSAEDFKLIMDFVKDKNADSAPMPKFSLDGERMKAMILDYDTKDVSECFYEAHNRYIDVMFALAGGEGLDMCAREELTPSRPYNEKDDMQWLTGDGKCVGHAEIIPGYFVMVWPHEAHKTQQHAIGFNHVKKIVIKLTR